MTRTHDTDWQSEAACRDWSPRVFFWDPGSREDDPHKKARAVAICNRCPVRSECLEYALVNEKVGSIYLGMAEFNYREHDAQGNVTGTRSQWRAFTASSTLRWGIWGGLAPEERQRLQKERDAA